MAAALVFAFCSLSLSGCLLDSGPDVDPFLDVYETAAAWSPDAELVAVTMYEASGPSARMSLLDLVAGIERGVREVRLAEEQRLVDQGDFMDGRPSAIERIYVGPSRDHGVLHVWSDRDDVVLDSYVEEGNGSTVVADDGLSTDRRQVAYHGNDHDAGTFGSAMVDFPEIARKSKQEIEEQHDDLAPYLEDGLLSMTLRASRGLDQAWYTVGLQAAQEEGYGRLTGAVGAEDGSWHERVPRRERLGQVDGPLPMLGDGRATFTFDLPVPRTHLIVEVVPGSVNEGHMAVTVTDPLGHVLETVEAGREGGRYTLYAAASAPWAVSGPWTAEVEVQGEINDLRVEWCAADRVVQDVPPLVGPKVSAADPACDEDPEEMAGAVSADRMALPSWSFS